MNRNEYVNKVLNEFAQKRAISQSVAVKNQALARKNPKYVELDRKERELVFTLGKLDASGKKDEKEHAKLKAIREEKEKILKQMGLSSADLEPKYSCKKCKDVGYYNGGACDCFRKRLNELLIKECGTGKESLSDFSDFNEKIIKDENQKLQLLKLKKKFQDLAKSYPSSSPKFILLSGKSGVGKTFIVECLAKALIERSFLVSFVSAFGMNNLLLSYHTSFDDKKQSYLNALLDPDVLVIDDLGTEPILKNVTLEYLLLILSERSRLDKLTIITTNLDLNELMDRYHERIFSRLCNKRESFIAQIEGMNLRLQQ